MQAELPFAASPSGERARGEPALDDARAADALGRQRAQTEFHRPLVLEAGAGTGKTATLVARVVAWTLAEGWERAERALGDASAEAPDVERIAARVLGRVTAITFTEAAAAEMASRIGAALAHIAAGGCPVGLDAERIPDQGLGTTRARALAAAMDHLGVSTIHGFCQRLLAQYPLQAGIHPQFRVDATGRAVAQAVREALERHLRDAWSSPPHPDALALAQEGVGPPELEQAVLDLVKGGVTGEAFAAEPLAAERVAALVGRARDALDRSLALAAPLASVRGSAGAAVSELSDARAVVFRLERDAPPPFEALELLQEASALSGSSAVERWAKGAFQKGELGVLDEQAVRELPPLARELRGLLQHASRLNPRRLALLHAVLLPLLADVRESLRRRGALSFDDLLRLASELLTRDHAVRRRVQGEIDQLLVDEFQDTDAQQCEIVRALALAAPGSGAGSAELPGLFIVGDPKQSIYAWRSADLSAYERFVDSVVAAGGAVDVLVVNFRSVPSILDEVERVVAPTMLAAPGLQPAFRGLVAHRSEASASPAVEYWVQWGFEDGAPDPALPRARADQIEARALARDLLERHATGELAFGDAAVLFRTTTDSALYLEALREAGVPYVVERDRNYYRRREVLEAAAWVTCIFEPRDHLALVAFLRSSAVGVPDAAWLPLWGHGFPDRMTRLREPDSELVRELETSIRAVALEVAASGAAGIERVAGWEECLIDAVRRIAELRDAFRRAALDVFVDRLRRSLLFEATESARFLGGFRAANLQRFFGWLEASLEESGGDPLQVLRELAEHLAGRVDAEEARPPESAEGAVRVMTLHKSKGLDFEHVYLAQLHKGQRKNDGNELTVRWHDGVLEYSLLGARTPGYDRVEAHRERVEEAERVRLLYVAMTRAKRRLVLSGKWPVQAPELGARVEQHIELVAIGRASATPDLQDTMTRLAASGASETDEQRTRWSFPALRPGSGGRGPDAPVPAPGPNVAEVAKQGRALAARRESARAHAQRPFARAASSDHGEWTGDGLGTGGDDPLVASVAGTLVHAFLEHFDFGAPEAPELEQRLAALDRALETAADPARRVATRRRARACLDAFVGGELWRRLVALGQDLLARELPVLLPPDDAGGAPEDRDDDGKAVGYVAGRIDLIYRDPTTGEVVAVDFKTDLLPDRAACEQRATAYAGQAARYRRALQEDLGLERPPRFELWFLVTDASVTV